MKFRIIEYLDNFKAQVGEDIWTGKLWDTRWKDIGLPEGYSDVQSAKQACVAYKSEKNPTIVEEFIL